MHARVCSARWRSNKKESDMHTIRTLYVGLIFLLAMPFCTLQASDLAKEKRWADQIVDALIDGEAVWLQAGKDKVLGIYTESGADKVRGAVIVLHGIGVHPDWPDVVYPLRVRLAEKGWHTLSLQMPILPNEADYKEYAPLFPEIAPRMQAAIAFLKEKGVNNIVVAGHSLGSTMAAYYLANHPASGVKALVCVGVSGIQFGDKQLGYFNSLSKLKLPVLDIYGSEDLKPVLESVAERAAIAKKAGVMPYDQVMVKGANHFFQGKAPELVKNVADWIDKNASKNQ
jgi:pimeloyl-ACP methyl ester carboxylesterase